MATATDPPAPNFSSTPVELLDYDALPPSLQRACVEFQEETIKRAEVVSKNTNGALTVNQILHYSKVSCFPRKGFGTGRNMRRALTGHTIAMSMEREHCPEELKPYDKFGDYSKWIKVDSQSLATLTSKSTY